MAGNPFYRDVDPAGTPPTVTPSDSPSSPSNFAGVTPHGRGPAPYDLQAPLDGSIAGAFDDANAVGGAGVLYPMGPRNQDARTLLESPQGFASEGFDIFGGYHGSWPADVEPDVAGP